MKNLLLLLLITGAFARSRPPVDPRLKDVRTIFVSGNNSAAEKIRSEFRKDAEKGKTCLTLVTNKDQADAVLEIATDAVSEGHLLGVRNWVANGNLTTKSGDMIWSSHGQSTDAPFSSGANDAGNIIYKTLRRDACGIKP